MIHGAGVPLQLVPRRAPKRRPTGGVAAGKYRVPQLADTGLDTLGRVRRGLAATEVARGQRPSGISQYGPERAEHSVSGTRDTDDGMGRENERVDR